MMRIPHVTAFALLCSAMYAGSVYAKEDGAPPAKRGERIFLGRETVAATIGGHELPLPPEVAACAGCHKPRTSDRNEQFAPPLSKEWLTVARQRRGGPPYAYDRDSFCNTVRTGIDPGYVILNRTMPRFALDDAQCRALWSYLSVRVDDETSPSASPARAAAPQRAARK